MALTIPALALTCLVLLGAGYLLFIALGRVAGLAPVIRDAWPILHMETLIVGTVAGAFWLGGWVLTAALLAHAARTGFEAARVAQMRHKILSPLAFGAGVAVLGMLASLLPIALLCWIGIAGVALCITVARSQHFAADTTPAVLLDLAVFPLLPLVVFTAAGIEGSFGVWLLAGFILVETFDSYALLGGKLIGGVKAFPHLSPNKTIGGLATGAVMLMLTAAVAGALLGGVPILTSAALALFAGVLSIVGDLTASRLKRKSGVKDYPTVLPHQGGLLDITDAWIATGAGLICLAAFFGPGG